MILKPSVPEQGFGLRPEAGRILTSLPDTRRNPRALVDDETQNIEQFCGFFGRCN
jgi:hypothetical protein